MIFGFPHKAGHGGPATFQKRFEELLKLNNWEVIYLSWKRLPNLLFIVGGSGKIFNILYCKFKGIPVILRLDGINWIHRRRKFNLVDFVRSEFQNLLIWILHRFFADYIVYQSHFVKNWWSKTIGGNPKHHTIIYNGINLSFFNSDINNLKNENVRLICLEGYLDYTPYAIDLINFLADHLAIPVEVYGKIRFDPDGKSLSKKVIFNGFVKNEDLPAVYRNSIYLSLDVNAACPNTVIEALACGAPVVGFDTGALKELVANESGIVVDYGGNPWKLDKPDFKALLDAINTVISGYSLYSENARQLAISRYDIKQMFAAYELVINKLITQKHH